MQYSRYNGAIVKNKVRELLETLGLDLSSSLKSSWIGGQPLWPKPDDSRFFKIQFCLR